MSTSVGSATEVRPFQVEIPKQALDDLRQRIPATRWAPKELVEDHSQGVQLATIEALLRYWVNDYDFGRVEARLNALPQFKTEIDGLGIHFIHVQSDHEDALPLILTHGWPGSVIEMLEVIGPLADPTAHGGSAEDAFDLVVPSLPGYGFSDQPTSVGWDPGRVAQAWAELMNRLGYTRYVAQGGDVGAAVTDTMAIQAPDGLAGIHLNFLRRPPLEVAAAVFGGAPEPEGLTEEERAAFEPFEGAIQEGLHRRAGPVAADDRLRPDGFAGRSGLLDPRPRHGQLREDLARVRRRKSRGWPHAGPDSRQHHPLLADGTGTSAARIYWEGARATAAAAAAGQTPPEVSLPVAFTVFPGEIFRAPRSWAETGLSQSHLLQRGRQGRPLRGLGGARALHRRAAGRLQVSALIIAYERNSNV